MHKPFLTCCICITTALSQAQTTQTTETRLLRSPSISQQHIAFNYAGDIWLADTDGQHPQRITVNPDVEQDPMLSPDGKWIAFSGNYDGNVDVYVVPVTGGTPKRITFHPDADIIRGWDGNDKVLFSSTRASFTGRYQRIFEVSIDGGPATPLKMPEAHQGNISPDGKYIAYIKSPDPSERANTYRPFRHYRGGNMPRIWIFNNKTEDVTEIPNGNSNNIHPVWLGNDVYFLSDRAGVMNVFSYDINTKVVTQITFHKDYDVKTLFSDGHTLVYEQAGRINKWEPASNKSTALSISLQTDLPYKRPHYVSLPGPGSISNLSISPTGQRVAVQFRGEILTIPQQQGDTRNITNSPGVNDRSPAWSPDGKWIAYFSDEGGEYALRLRDQKAASPAITITLGEPSFYDDPVWSPDSKKLAFRDKHLRLFYIDIATKKITQVDEDLYDRPDQDFFASWSPDSRWLTYNRRLENDLQAVFVCNLATNTSYQLTDGRSEAREPAFSHDGKYLFFTASTNFAQNTGWLDMSSFERNTIRSIYAIVLPDNAPSPLAPLSDEEPDDSSAKKSTDTKVRIDLDNISQRIVALNLPASNYSSLSGLVPGHLLYMEGNNLFSYDISKHKSNLLMAGISNYQVSANGEKLLYSDSDGSGFGITGTGSKSDPGEGRLSLSGVKVLVDPTAEWKQIFDETWRIERDYFYVSDMHGVDWKAMKQKYEIFLPYVGHREDLNYLLNQMNSELVIGHNYISQGDAPSPVRVGTGLLGADYEVENGHYRIKKIYTGLNWNPQFYAPLTQPGIQVQEGDYLLSVNGIQVTADRDIYSYFVNTDGKQTRIVVGKPGINTNVREFTVIPISSEGNLRLMDWVEGNRRKVDALSHGKLAYVYMPNTGGDGYTFFNRYYFSQLDKKGVIIDERFNGGGSAADYVIDLLNRELLNYWGNRDGKPMTTPGNAIFGPKAMIINGYAGSGGDLMPFMFKEKKLGHLVGTRTMGILVGIYNYPSLIDGGSITAPRLGIFSKDGKWIVENEGITPDDEVEMMPKDVIAGHDPQLEKTVSILMQDVKDTPPVKKPAGPNKAL
jgi:tricorn protease